ncbi:MAG: PqqD family protein [Acidobacteriota bacterium]
MSDHSALAADAAIAHAEGLVASDVNGEVVILSIEAGHFFHLNPTGSRIWNLLDGPMTVAALSATMAERFAVGADECRRDVTEFVEAMLDKGLLERV